MVPPLIYVIFGQSRELCIGMRVYAAHSNSAGPFALTSLMSAKAILAVVPSPEADPAAAVAAAITLAFVVGLIQVRLRFVICTSCQDRDVAAAPGLPGRLPESAAGERVHDRRRVRHRRQVHATRTLGAHSCSQLSSLLGVHIPSFPDEEAGLVRTYAVRCAPTALTRSMPSAASPTRSLWPSSPVY